jgi:S-DNA-T family DNA segregation ATPase FtsK/SpoIIIE
MWGMVGVGGDTLEAVGPDLASGMPCFIVAGPAKSGRSTILLSLARSFLAAGTPLVLAAPRPSPLRALSGVPGVLGLFDGPELSEAELAEALSSFTRPGVVLIDDAELLRDCGAASELSRLVTRGRRREHRRGIQWLAGGSQTGPARLPDRARHHPGRRPDRHTAPA